jgi:pyruvate dehydrogenase E2 component (dihydrolipoamide acetyltransferase)
MPIDVTMPKLSDTMEEGRILRWLKQPGDAVKIGEILAEVETDKANMELEAFDEGTLAELRVAENESAPVGSVIAVLAAPGEQAAGAKPAAKPAAAPAPAKATSTKAEPARAATTAPKAEPAKTAAAKAEAAPAPAAKAEAARAATKPAAPRAEAARPAPAKAGGSRDAEREPWRPTVVVRRAESSERDGEAKRIKASPLARRIAEESGIDLASIEGSGPGGRVVEQDVQAALASRGGRASADAPPAPARTEKPRPTEAAPQGGGRRELSRIRRTTAKRMAEAKREVPHFYASAEIAMDEAARAKDALARLGGEFEGLTYTHLVLKAVGLTLRQVPELNASYDGDAMILHEAVNVGLATATDEGLVVPVVRDCDRARLAELVRQTQGLVERARGLRFAPDDLSGATFTVSNLGMFPVSDFAAIINPPQAAILAVGAVRTTPVVRDGAVVPGRVMTVTLSCDHRILDGVLAGRFLRELKALLENPIALVV